MTMFSLPPLFMVPVVGVLADLYGRRTTILTFLTLYGVAGMAIIFAGSFETVLVLRFVQGVGYAGTQPLGVTLIGDLYSGTRESAAQGLYSSSLGFGNIVAPVLAGALLALGWFFPFLIFAGIFPVVVLVYLYLTETATERTDRDGRVVATVREYHRRHHERVAQLGHIGYLRRCYLRVLRQVRGPDVPPALRRPWLRRERCCRRCVALCARHRSAVRVATQRSGRRPVLLTVRHRRHHRFHRRVPRSASVDVECPLGGGRGGVQRVRFHLSPVINDTTVNLGSDEHRAGIVSGLIACKNVGKTLAPAVLGVVLTLGGFYAVFWGGRGHPRRVRVCRTAGSPARQCEYDLARRSVLSPHR